MTDLAVQDVETTLVISTPASTQIVAALDPPVVLTVAPQSATLAVQVVRSGLLTTPAAQGPMGPPGPKGDAGPQGEAGNAVTAIFPVPNPSTTWVIAHNLNRYPAVTLVDTTGDVVLADVAYLDANTIAIAFGFATAGSAYLN